jgi:signal transduction histidine kinase
VSRPRVGRADRRRLGIRLALLLSILAGGLTALSGRIVCGMVDEALERRAHRALDRRLEHVELVIRDLGRRADATLGRLAAELRRHGPATLERLRAGGGTTLEDAARLGAATDLDLLTILDGREVVSSMHWPQLVGLEEPSLVGLAEGDAVLRRVEGPSGSRPAVVVQRSLEPPRNGTRLVLVGGCWLDSRFASAVAGPEYAGWFDLAPGGAEAAFSDRVEAAGAEVLREVAAGAAAVASRSVRLPDGELAEWTVARRELHDDAGRALGTLVVAIPRETRLLPRLRLAFLIVGVVAVALAVAGGFWTASRITRPVDRLVRAVDAIAAGEADYTFPKPAGHELERLTQAFSRLQRSLELETRRAAAAERVAAWKEVARRVAHEVKNPLVPIRLTVENLIRAREKDPRLFAELFPDGARTILEEVEQLRRLVTEFSEFARLPAARPRPLELHDLLDDVLELHAAEPDLRIVRAYAAARITLRADPEQLARVLKNVVGNAVEAMRETARPPRLEVGTEAGDGIVEVRVCDNGPGIAPDVEGRVFEPYVTTKPGGTGLGMAIAERIVTEHGGVIEAGNRPEGGTCVRLRLPLDGDEARA